MKISIIIPAHNEADVIEQTLDSLVNQTIKPHQLIIVNDSSTDNTEDIIKTYTTNHSWISYLNSKSESIHQPGTKVINAFYKGYDLVDKSFDIICKFDADIVFPNHYLETIKSLFENNPKLGISGGLLEIKKANTWVYENIANKDHVRGPIKAYSKACFNAIGGLRKSIGWDTVDVLLAKHYDFLVETDKTLIAKHLKPTGFSYNKSSKYLQGEAFYKMRYGFLISLISALKIALKKRSLTVFSNYIIGYFKASKNNIPYIVSKKEGQFIRDYRWKGIKSKLF